LVCDHRILGCDDNQSCWASYQRTETIPYSKFEELLKSGAVKDVTRVRRESALRSWGLLLWKRLGFKRAATALARKMAVVLHSMWKSGTAFNPTLSAVTP
jgi:hypothetical protein